MVVWCCIFSGPSSGVRQRTSTFFVPRTSQPVPQTGNVTPIVEGSFQNLYESVHFQNKTFLDVILIVSESE